MTGSTVGRVLQCPASEVLPRSGTAFDEPPSQFSEAGTQAHAEAEMAADGGDLDSLPDELSAVLEGIDGGATYTEVAMAIDAATGEGRILRDAAGVQIHGRAYADAVPPLGPFEIAATLDLCVVSPTELLVVDHKFFESVGRPSENGQVMTQAAAASRVWPGRRVRVGVCYLARDRVHVEEVDDLDLDSHVERLRLVHVQVAAAKGALNELAEAVLEEDADRLAAARVRLDEYVRVGPACKRCPAFAACPRQTALVSLVRAPDAEERVEAMIPFGDDDEAAAEGYELLKRIRLLANRLEAALRARAAERPIPLGDGKVFGRRQTRGREELDGRAVYAALAELHGAAAALAAVEIKATKERIEDVARSLVKAAKVAKAEKGARPTLKATMDGIMGELRARGAARQRPGGWVVDEHVPRFGLELPEAVEVVARSSDEP